MIRLKPKHGRRGQNPLKLHMSILRAFGIFLKSQVDDRFTTQGTSGGEPWPDKQARAWGHNDGRAVLSGRTGRLRQSFQVKAKMAGANESGAVTVFSNAPYARIQQLGTKGKGGELPTIEPVSAKALFIPITDRAAGSALLGKKLSVAYRRTYGLAATGRKVRARSGSPLKQGKLENNRLMVKGRDGQWRPGIPDFIFLKKADISPRPMLPISSQEIAAQKQFITTMLRVNRAD
jgi:hypothetical protein